MQAEFVEKVCASQGCLMLGLANLQRAIILEESMKCGDARSVCLKKCVLRAWCH